MQKSNNILIYEPDIKGHRLEYVHHLYIGSINSDKEFIFILPPSFSEKKEKYEWPERKNCKIVLLSQKEMDSMSGNSLKKTFANYQLIKKYTKQFHVSTVFLIMLIQYLPIILLFYFSKIKFEGIIYRIYLYDWVKDSLKQKITEAIKWKLLASTRTISKAYILNDNSAATYLNKLFSSNKFQYLVDPFAEILYTAKDKRQDLGIPKENKVFLHFGGLTRRKGTIDIINAISILTQEEKESYTFIFAGEIYKDIKDEFYAKYNQMKESVNIILYDEFCSYELLNDLCYTCDCILIPYYNNNQSSGIISYAAYYNKPVIGPKGGLLGKLIRKFRLGIDVDLSNGIHKYLSRDIISVSNRYKQEHSTSIFTQTIIDSL